MQHGSEGGPPRSTGVALIKDSEDHDTLSKLSRYEAGLMNAVARTLSVIQRFKFPPYFQKNERLHKAEY
jgi:hypothetical protein